MKVILKQDVRALGKRGDVKEVSDGYARNFLLPKGVAVEATASNVNVLDTQKKSVAHREAREETEARDLAKKLAGLTITIRTKTGENGRLFGSITGKDIADELVKTGIELDKRKIELDEAIKTLGNHIVKIHLYKGITAELTVSLVAE